MGGCGADRRTGSGALDQIPQIFHITLSRSDLQQRPNHATNLVSQKALAEEVEIDAFAPTTEPHPKEGANGCFSSWIWDRKRRPVVPSLEQVEGG